MNYVYIATSLDGFIATSDGGVDWLHELPNPEMDDYGFGEFMEKIDALVMGRKTYEQVLTFGDWPYEKPVFVLSTTLTEVPAELEGKVEFLSGEPADIQYALNERGYENLYIDGGNTIQRFLAADLIDELFLTRIPVLLGSGIPLFGDLPMPLPFNHLETTIYGDLVTSHYER